MENPSPQQPRRRRLTIGAGVVLVLLAVGVAVLVAALSPHGTATTIEAPSGPQVSPSPGDSLSSSSTAPPSRSSDSSGGAPPLFVHILGEVVNPGLYELSEGDRAIDAVAAAGGLTETADETQLNLARFLNDGEQIIVPAIGAVPAQPPGTSGAGGSGAGGPGVAGGVGAKISINTADASTLEDLPGVGPELASRIVAWRETNGPYTSVDDLLNVAGIGEKTVDGLRDSATT